MKTERVDITRVIEDRSNARVHDRRNIDAIKESLRRWGQQKPIVVNKDGVVVAGNGTLQAARLLGWKKIDIVRTTLTGVESVAFAIADNRTAELAEWSDDLKDILKAIHEDETIDADVTGFTVREIGEYIDAIADEPDAAEAIPDASQFGGVSAMSRASAPQKFWRQKGYIKGAVLDFGCGHEDHGYARYDAFTYPDTAALLQTYDTVVCNYVLNVQPSEHLVTLIVALLAKLTKPTGRTLIAIRNDLPEGIHRSDRGVQMIRSTDAWQDIIGQFFWIESVEDRKFLGYVCTPMIVGKKRPAGRPNVRRTGRTRRS